MGHKILKGLLVCGGYAAGYAATDYVASGKVSGTLGTALPYVGGAVVGTAVFALVTRTKKA